MCVCVCVGGGGGGGESNQSWCLNICISESVALHTVPTTNIMNT